MDVVIAVITAEGKQMNKSEEPENTPATATVEATKPKKKASVGARGAHVAPKKGKSAKKATPVRKSPKGRKKPDIARAGSKTAKILDLLKRSGGATMKELIKTTGWQPHSVRGFLSGTVGKKMRLTVVSAKGENGERAYSLKT
jgi:hypothetical protein